MTSFNDIAGVPSTANRWLVTTLLRGEWGFAGFVVSDWTGVAELQAHGVAASRADAGRLALAAGGGMDMQRRSYLEDLPAPVGRGLISPAGVGAAGSRGVSAQGPPRLFRGPHHRAAPA